MTEQNENEQEMIFCPFTANVCPGENKCAPAVFSLRNAQKNTDEDLTGKAVCPIIAGIGSLTILAQAVIPMLNEQIEDSIEVEQIPVHKTKEELIAQVVDQDIE